ncbi:MAG: MBL fold metallo-hydrolase [Deltaproteobacteria bacterium]|nr:MBL fold metallo-hydrolase [Deltaproteobacteria bacterium]
MKEYRRTVKELRPGIFQLAGWMPDCHSYVIRGKEKNLLIDTGLPQAGEAIRTSLGEIGLALEDIDLVVLSHEHLDHIGSAPLFFATAMIATHRLAAMKIRLQDEFAMMNQLFGLSADGFRVDICLEGGSVIQAGNYNLTVIHTPGHSSGSICLYEADQRLVFTGDTVLTEGNIGGVFGSGSISDYIESIERLKMLQVDAYYPGHGPASKDPPREFQAAIDRATTILADSKALFNVVREKNRFEHIREYMKHLND